MVAQSSLDFPLLGLLGIWSAAIHFPRCVDNCIYKSKNAAGRNFIGGEIEECKNLSSLFGIYPFKKVWFCQLLTSVGLY